MTTALTGTVHMWITYLLVIASIIGFASERIRIEVTSLLILAAMLATFELFPITNFNEENPLNSTRLLIGFANPALVAVLALQVIGNGLRRSGALDWVLKLFLKHTGKRSKLAIFISFATVFVVSPFVNNTPVVVIFIPILETISRRHFMSPSSLMMPLSFIAILAGMTTLVGSSTNLLVSGTLGQLGEEPLGFFDFTIPGLILAGTGLLYILFVMPHLLPQRHSPFQRFITDRSRHFIAQLTVGSEAKLIGANAKFNLLGIRGTRLLLVQRGEHSVGTPFSNLKICQGDILIVMATQTALAETQTKFPRLMFSASGKLDLPKDENDHKTWLTNDQLVVEAMVAPGSGLAGHTLKEIGFRARYNCLVLGIERHSRVIRRHLTDTMLQEGDVLVLQGNTQTLDNMREQRNLILLDGSIQPVPSARNAKNAGIIFTATIITASTGILPIAAAAVIGVVLMLITRVLTLPQATAALDQRIFLMVGTSLALGAAMLETGAASYLAQGVIAVVGSFGPVVVLSTLFLLVAFLTNIMSNNATAIIFTPIALSLASSLHTSPTPFILAVLFGANCSFATPISYQTNLLVMSPGYYRFKDFIRAGGPLVIILWIAFSLFIPRYYGILH
ncbi:SLC13 family permease [Sneathiella sp. P13V-1]|uniref:SLC13 family permease n=1 Tax=Sneathiella sp. P13V-1 TaxID=2697366 RepID=UPI00187B5A62|nr:SLC13 family permease [Sneathiella sp. P13V-1]MBE7637793.1 SLC13 family permease [Sneathiella sp. P13V-1]